MSDVHGAPRSRIRPVPVLLGLVVFAGTARWSASFADFHLGDTPTADDLAWYGGSAAGLLVVAILIHLTVHEIGHLLAATAMGLPVVGFRVGVFSLGRRRRLPGSGGHVLIDVTRARRWVPGRMVVTLLAGPAANLLAAAVAAGIANDETRSVAERSVAAGVTVGGVVFAALNLLPITMRGGTVADGRQIVRWLLRPAAQRARVQLAIDLGRLRRGAPKIAAGATRRVDELRAAADDPRPEVATEAITELLGTRVAGTDLAANAGLVARFAVRRDVAGDVRARVAGLYSLALALGHISRLQPGAATGPEVPEVQRLAELGELALAADRESLPARTALGMARILQDRPEEARAVLIDVAASWPPVARARALAVRGMAESELGASDAAVRLGDAARRLAPDDSVLRLLDAMLAAAAPDGAPQG